MPKSIKYLLYVIISIILIFSILFGIILYGMSGCYNYNRGVNKLKALIPDTIEMFNINRDKFENIVSVIKKNEVIRNINISYNQLNVSSAFYANGYFFPVEIIDLSVMEIVYKLDIERKNQFMVYCEEFCEDWYIIITNQPKG